MALQKQIVSILASCMLCLLFTSYAHAKITTFFDDSKRYDISVVPRWGGVLKKINDGEILKENAKIGKYEWRYIKQKWKDLPIQERIEKINALFNVYPYIEDKVNYKIDDYWASPLEFIKNSGDCEDYAIVKWHALLQLGIKESAMRILVVIDSLRGIGHAVLLVQNGNEIYLLDNTTELVLPIKMYSHYVQQFSVDKKGVYLQ